ncbi:hypothetical protein [Streptomyces kronopolitis]|uniref:hypothetical protein n=1 Tax=Streptomyces kronopolitis TaxID=1612435 RepID=UPI003D987A60
MRVGIALDLGGGDIDGAEPTVEFAWEIGALPLPRGGERIAFGELFTVVRLVQYLCPDADYIASREVKIDPVTVELRLALPKAFREAGFTLPELRATLAGLPCVSELYVPGVERRTA